MAKRTKRVDPERAYLETLKDFDKRILEAARLGERGVASWMMLLDERKEFRAREGR